MEAKAISGGATAPNGSGHSRAQRASQIGAHTVSAFGEIVERLEQIRGVSTDLSTDLDGIAALSEANDPPEDLLPKVHGLLVEFAESLEDQNARDGEAEVLRDLSVAQDYVARIHRFALTLSAVATMSRTTTASLGIDALRGYFEELTQTATVIGTAASEIGARIEDVRKSVAASSEGLAHARSGVVGVVPHVKASIVKEERLAADEARAANRVRERATRLSGEARLQIKSFADAIQFPNRQNQRFEHIEHMLKNPDGHVARLAAAQCRSLASDMSGMADGVRDTITRLSQFGGDAKGLLSEGEVSSAIETNLSNRSDIGEAISAQLSSFRVALNAVRERGEECTRAFGAMRDSLGVLERASKSVALAAVNSTIFASRSGDARGPLATLSLEVRDTATRCLEAVGGTQSATNAAITKNRDAASVLIDSGTALEEAVEAYHSETRSGEERFTRLSKLRGSATERTVLVLEHSDFIKGVVQRVSEACSELEALASELEEIPAEGQPDAALLKGIYDTYTMEEERRVHAKVFGNGGEEVPASVVASTAGKAETVDDLFL